MKLFSATSSPVDLLTPVPIPLSEKPQRAAVTVLPNSTPIAPLASDRPPELAVGDWAVYPTQGVVQVVSIGPRDIAGAAEPYYGLRATQDGTRLLVPVRRLTRSGLRRLVCLQEVPVVMATLRDTPPARRPPCYKWHQLLAKKLNTGALIAIAEVLRDVSHVKNARDLSATERHLLDIAQHRLVTELSLVTGRGPESFERDLARIFRRRS